jgi:hypothetical protein
MLTLLLFASLISLGNLFSNLLRLCIGSLIASFLLAYHTCNVHPFDGNSAYNKKIMYYLGILIAMLLFSLTTGVFSYYFAMPSQGL